MAGRNYTTKEDVRELHNSVYDEEIEREKVNEILSKFAKDSEFNLDDGYDTDIIRESEDARPTERTLGYVKTQKASERETEKAGLSLKNKVMILIYVIAVCGLLLAIMITNAKINGSLAEYNELYEQQKALAGEVAELNSQIAEFEKNLDVEAKARELGFDLPSASSQMQFSAPVQRAPLTYTVDKNFFDAICDFFSGLFGA